MFCKTCGNQIPNDVKFCPHCGGAVSPAPSGSPPPSGGYSASSSGYNSQHRGGSAGNNRKGSDNKLPLIIGLAVLFLIAVIGGVILVLTLREKKTSGTSSVVEEIQKSDESEEKGSGDKDEDSLEDSKTPAGGKSEETVNIIPPNSAEDDGNLFGNSHCYARIISDGTCLYFRNALDKEHTYWIKKGETEPQLLTDLFMKDLHYKDGWIYYSRTTEGDRAAGTRDNNIYRMKTDASSNTNLTNLIFDNPQSWLSFETMTAGKCFFVYTDGKGITMDIGYAPESGGAAVFLSRIPAANAVDNPCINVVENNVYFLAKDGLHCVDLNTKADHIVISGFSCEEYLIYDGVIYFWTGERQGEPHAKLSSIKLDGTERKDLFVSPLRTGFSYESMQINLYQGKLYFLLHTSYAEEKTYGSLYKAELDGSGCEKLIDDISWFNLVDHTLYYRYIDSQNSADEKYQFAPYYQVPFQSVTEGRGAADRTILFDTEPYKEAANRLPAEVLEAYNRAKPYLPISSSPSPEDLEIIGGNASYMDTSPSSIIDHGSYYEITNCSMSVPLILPADIVSQLRIGYQFTISQADYEWNNATYTVASYPAYEYYDYSLSRPNGNSGYADGYIHILDDGTAYVYGPDNDELFQQRIYFGSLYFSKECQVYPVSYAQNRTGSPISIQEYLTQDHDVETTSFFYGFRSQYVTTPYFYLCGHPSFDSNGLIISYVEQFYP
ncbi:DUF5050 domain-containing protein [Lachnospiraceae bacterium 62-35]